MSEARVQFEILNAWGAHPRVRFWRQNVGKAYPPGSDRLVTFGVPGCADVIGLIKPTGRFLAIECKRAKGGKQSEDQQRFERVVTAMGGLYVLAKSLEDVDAALIPIVGPR